MRWHNMMKRSNSDSAIDLLQAGPGENDYSSECDDPNCDQCRAKYDDYSDNESECTDPNCTECRPSGPKRSAEMDLPATDSLTVVDIEAVNKVYTLLRLERIATLEELKEAIKTALLVHHSDKKAQTSHAKDSEDKARQLIEAKKVVDSLLKSPKKRQQYEFFQRSCLVLISNHPQFAKEIIHYVMTFTTYENGQETNVKPSAQALNSGHFIYQNIAAFVTLLIPAMQKLREDFVPSVLKDNNDDQTVITADNYTVSELLALYKLIVSGKHTLPYPLRYVQNKDRFQPDIFGVSSAKKFTSTEELHRLLTFAINLEMANREYYHYARDEVASVEFTRDMSNGLWLAACVVMLIGVLFTSITLKGLALTAPIFLYASVALMIVIPAVLALVSVVWGYFPVKNFNTFIANTAPMMKEYFFQNCGTTKVQLNSFVFFDVFNSVQDLLGKITEINYPNNSFKKAEFTLGERAGIYAGSFFGSSTSSNKYTPLVQPKKLQEIKVESAESSSIPAFGTSKSDGVD